MSKPYRVLDLFSGLAGFTLGLEAAGMETVAFCEISEPCRRLLAHYWPEVKQYDDITTLTAERLATDGIGANLLCGGFPCQDISYAGNGAGLEGERSGLWFQIARLLRELRDIGRPIRFVVLENVSALLSLGLGVVLGDLAALGFNAEWDCIPASAIGLHHQRDRIWIVAYPGGEQHEGFGDAFRRALAKELSETYSLADAEKLFSDRGNNNFCGSEECSKAVSEPGNRHGYTRARLHWQIPEPDVGRVAHGVPARVDRLHGLGNAVVPQIPEILGRAIIAAEEQCARLAA